MTHTDIANGNSAALNLAVSNITKPRKKVLIFRRPTVECNDLKMRKTKNKRIHSDKQSEECIHEFDIDGGTDTWQAVRKHQSKTTAKPKQDQSI